ncbi:MAG: SDR family oxidoreductase [Proteobacteria bacterium]|nr:SDR family oxidoreductase [Pseudomonadota bacterium]
MRLSFSGQTVLIAGGSCDMAIELAGLLIEAGLRPILSFRSPEGREKIMAALPFSIDLYQTCGLDFSRRDTLSTVFDDLPQGPDYLVDFAQGDYETLVSSADTRKTDCFLEENIAFRAAFLKKTTRLMIKKKFGRLVFVSSGAAGRPNQGQGFYAASKLAAEALYKNIALELGSFGISSVSLRPGYVACGRGKSFIENNQDRLIRQIPNRHWLSSRDVAETIVFLLSDGARGFNATELVMDGGIGSGKHFFA